MAEQVLQMILTQGGLAGALLVAVVFYLLKKELAFAQERKDFSNALEARNTEIYSILKEAVAFQTKIEMLLLNADKDHDDLIARFDDLKSRLVKQMVN